MTKDKAAIGCMTILVVILVITIIAFASVNFLTTRVFGNKQIIDFNRQTFTHAYILADSNVWQKCKIKAWKDFENSDSIQIVFEDNSYLYTHLRNVKLSSK